MSNDELLERLEKRARLLGAMEELAELAKTINNLDFDKNKEVISYLLGHLSGRSMVIQKNFNENSPDASN